MPQRGCQVSGWQELRQAPEGPTQNRRKSAAVAPPAGTGCSSPSGIPRKPRPFSHWLLACALHSRDPLQGLCTCPALCLGLWVPSCLATSSETSPKHPPPSASSPYPPLILINSTLSHGILAAPLFVICPPPSPTPGCKGQEGRQGRTWSALCTPLHPAPSAARHGLHALKL